MAFDRFLAAVVKQMNMNFLSRARILVLFLACGGCTKVEDEPSALVGTSPTLLRDCGLFPLEPEKKRRLGVDYELIDKDSNNSGETDKWVKAGERLEIYAVKRITIDERGTWRGVLGKRRVSGEQETRSFVYNISFGQIPAWEKLPEKTGSKREK